MLIKKYLMLDQPIYEFMAIKKSSDTESNKKTIKDRLDEIAWRVKAEREDRRVLTYQYEEDEFGHFTVELQPT